jgi:hypothetical protein
MAKTYAFPHSYPAHEYTEAGMTLRDWFAGQALQGWIARSSGIRVADSDVMAEMVYMYADAMLGERQKYEKAA